MSSKKQTAVEWLQEAMSNKLNGEIGPYFLDLFEQALAKEKLNIYLAYLEGHSKDFNSQKEALLLMSKYYNETFDL